MADFLLELRSEEIPARMQDKARDDLARLFSAELEKAGLRADAIVTFATPRRLALIARDLPTETAAVSEEVKGPRIGAPPQALEGFLRKTGLAESDLVERDGLLFAVIDKPGRRTADVLAEAIPAIVRQFPWPKSMRWGEASASTESLRWVRPLHGIVALLGEDVVPCEIAGVRSGNTTVGHRFMSSGPVTVQSAAHYADALHAAKVIVDQDIRRTVIRQEAEGLADVSGLKLVEDEGLVAENAGLTEWPECILACFDEEFLQVPPEVIQLTARVNQKYFVCRDNAGKLTNAFICTANIKATDGGAAIAEGNRKVLAARLADARFFYDTDLKVPLEEQVKKLEKIVFHEKLGTVADKVERVAKLARWLVEEGVVVGSNPTQGASELADQAERAARLAKADLVTGMVGEFPELQGLMGGYYAAAQGEDPAVAEAIRDHYKPVGQGDEVPTAPVTVAVSLADKIDTMASFFFIGELPSGSRDPFAIRRSAIAILRLVMVNHLRMSLRFVFEHALRAVSALIAPRIEAGAIEPNSIDYAAATKRIGVEVRTIFDLHDAFMLERFEGLVDFPVDITRAAVNWNSAWRDPGTATDFVRLHALLTALQSFVGTEDGANLLAGYKRAANILKKEGYSPLPSGEEGARSAEPSGKVRAGESADLDPHPSAPSALPPSPTGRGNLLSYTPEKAEGDLIAALDAAEPAAADAVGREDFEVAMAALATLRAPIDAFFDSVTVNDPDPAKREARLALLARVRDAVHGVADFSKIEG